jgi:hypothetical protein
MSCSVRDGVALWLSTPRVSRWGPLLLPPTATTRRFWSPPWRRLPRRWKGCPRGERPPRPRLRLASDPRASSGAGTRVGDLGEGQARTVLGHEEVGGGEDERVAQRPQEALLVHGEGGEGDRLLGGLLRGGDHREAAHPRKLEPLPLGAATIPTTVSPIDGSSNLLLPKLSWLLTKNHCKIIRIIYGASRQESRHTNWRVKELMQGRIGRYASCP